MAKKTLDIEQEYFIRAPVSRVFAAITEPEDLARWFLLESRLPPKTGAEYEFVWQGGYRHRGEVLAFVRNRRLSLAWPNRVGRVTKWSRVTFTVTRKGKGTLLRLQHVGYPNTGGWVRIYGLTQCGWAYFLVNLRSMLEHGFDLRSEQDQIG